MPARDCKRSSSSDEKGDGWACWGMKVKKRPERAGSRVERRFRSRDCARARRTTEEADSRKGGGRSDARRSGRERIKWMPGG